MKTYYTGIIVVLVLVVAMLLYPMLHTMTSQVNTTGFLPLTKAVGVTFAPWFFLFMALYALFKFSKR